MYKKRLPCPNFLIFRQAATERARPSHALAQKAAHGGCAETVQEGSLLQADSVLKASSLGPRRLCGAETGQRMLNIFTHSKREMLLVPFVHREAEERTKPKGREKADVSA